MIMRGGSGLGDSLYLRPLAEHLVARGEKVTIASNFPDVFLDSGVTVVPFRRHPVDMVAHYVGGKNNPETTIWEDICAHARLQAQLGFRWRVRNEKLVERVRAAGKPVVIVHGGREPMGRRDRFGIELMPARPAFCAAIEGLADCFTVRVGKGDELYSLPADLDLSNRTTVADLLDLAWTCSGMVAQCSFVVPLAEAFDKPLLAVWSSQGLVSANQFIRTVTPHKMLTKPTSHYVMDDEAADAVRDGARLWAPRHEEALH